MDIRKLIALAAVLCAATANVTAAVVERPGAVRKTVAFLGGSITEMNGFRPRVMKALREKYPQVDFLEVAAGLSSTCSDAGAFRLEEDVLAKGTPDLFIVEAAVNDDQDGHFTSEHSIRGMEGSVRHVLTRNPSCAVVVALMVNRGQFRALMNGATPLHYAAHAKVAKHYGAALADVGSALAASAKSGGMGWKEYRDCHPSSAGCDLGAKVVMDAVVRVFDPLVSARACRRRMSSSARDGTCRVRTGSRFPATSAHTIRKDPRSGANEPGRSLRSRSGERRRGFS